MFIVNAVTLVFASKSIYKACSGVEKHFQEQSKGQSGEASVEPRSVAQSLYLSAVLVAIATVSISVVLGIYICLVAANLFFLDQYVWFQLITSVVLTAWSVKLCPMFIMKCLRYFEIPFLEHGCGLYLSLQSFVLCFSTVIAPVTAVIATGIKP